jgi:8-oxo-dGTP diphosphatase
VPRGDLHETSEAAWGPLADLPSPDIQSPVRWWITEALDAGSPPYLS